MQLRIVAVGRVREAFIRDGIAEYQKRLQPFARVDIVEVKEQAFKEGLAHAEKLKVLEREGEALINALIPGYLILLDIEGKMLSSEQLAEQIADLQLHGHSAINFIIGGSLGVAQSVRSRADMRLSFGPLTFPHQLFRLILLEQVYRASTLIRGIPYHK